MKNLLLLALLCFTVNGYPSNKEFICTYKVTFQSNPYDDKTYTEKNPKLLDFQQKKIEFTRIASEEKRKVAELELELRKVKAKNAEILYDNEIKLKELELKYNAQIDSQQIKADADLNKMLVAESTKDFREAARSSQMVQDQVRSLYEQGNTGQTKPRSEPSEQS